MSNIIDNPELDLFLKIEEDMISECSILTPIEMLKLASDEAALEGELAERLAEREYSQRYFKFLKYIGFFQLTLKLLESVDVDVSDKDDFEMGRKYVPGCLLQYYGTPIYEKARAYYLYALKRMVKDNNNNRVCPDT